MELDQELKNLALDWAEKVYSDIYIALTNPDRSISGNELKIYEELKAWGFFDKFTLLGDEDEDEDKELSHTLLIMILARERYNKLKHDKDHPPPKKMSKWEFVTGKVPKK